MSMFADAEGVFIAVGSGDTLDDLDGLSTIVADFLLRGGFDDGAAGTMKTEWMLYAALDTEV
jgi:hypothetical protein